MKKWLIGAAVAVVLIVVGWIVGTKIYASNASSDAAPPTVSAGSETANADADIDGDWKVGGGDTFAGYRVGEVLNDQQISVTGRTDQVTGTVTVKDKELTAANIEVDMASVKTDSDRRDGYFANRAIDVATNPKATFTVTSPVKVAGTGAVEVPGEMTIKGKTVPVTAKITVAKVGDGLEAAGTVDVTWRDFDVEPPNMGFVSVEETGSIEFKLKLSK
ncbi:MAG: YceI family protein [Corynebacterium sp.]|nr:YceI family protein [Corynebacterium sp.]